MGRTYRIIDANINRISEGIRVLEDISRFEMEDSELTDKLKALRHHVRKNVKTLEPQFLLERDSGNDIGLEISERSTLDDKKDISELIPANFKRIQEGLRVIEENLKIAGHYELSKIYEACRFIVYDIEKSFHQAFNKNVRSKFPDTDLYCLTSHEHSNGKENIDVVREMIDAGISIIQYREKDKSMLEKYNECKVIRELTKEAGVTFIVNDNVDLAILTGADGVHIGQDDLPIEDVRRLVGRDVIIGISTHSKEQAEDAVQRGADYIGVGPIFKTDTKKDVCDPVGLDYLDYVVEHIRIPFVAIGGIKEHNISEVHAHGAKCIALVTEIVGAENIGEMINRLREEVQK